MTVAAKRKGLRMRSIVALALGGIIALAGCSAAASPVPSGTPSATPAPAAARPPVATGAAASPTGDELQLLARVRLDLQTACAPYRTGLAPAAVAGIECRPASDVVDRVVVTLFESQQDLLSAYLAGLAAHDVLPRTNSGRCVVGQGSEGAYTPGDSGPILIPERGGCYVDATGMAHYAATQPPFVLIELDGKVGDAAVVEHYAWLGNQDQPGSPTIWQSGGPASPEK